jgi:hypothetical protein
MNIVNRFLVRLLVRRALQVASDPVAAKAATTAKVARLVPRCELCHSANATHQYVLLSSRTLGSYETANQYLLDLAITGSGDIPRDSIWDPVLDSLVWYSIRCGNGRMRVLAVFSPSELWDEDRAVSIRVIENEQEESRLASRIDESKWRQLSN